jgi:hypothetical protein
LPTREFSFEISVVIALEDFFRKDNFFIIDSRLRRQSDAEGLIDRGRIIAI